MKILVQFRTLLNVAWGTPVNGIEAFAFMRGFPGTFLMGQRRVVVIGEFLEKQGMFRMKIRRSICFEAGLHEIKERKISVIKKKGIIHAYISFNPHGNLGESTIQFLRMDTEVWQRIDNYLDDLEIKNPVLDTGIILIDEINPIEWLNTRHGLKIRRT